MPADIVLQFTERRERGKRWKVEEYFVKERILLAGWMDGS